MKTDIKSYDELFQYGKNIELTKGGVLHDAHDQCRAIGKVLGGRLRLSRLLSSGREIILKEFGPGEIFAELIVFSGDHYPGWLIASEQTTVIEVEYSHVLKYLEEQDSMIEFIVSISKKLNHLTNRIEVMSLKTVKQKIAFSLLTENINTMTSITDWADYLGCSREALSRTLSELQNTGAVRKKGGLIQPGDSVLLESLLYE